MGGIAFGFRIRKIVFGFYLGYGRPVWWIPKFIGRGRADFGFGLGWLLLSFRMQVYIHSKFFES